MLMLKSARGSVLHLLALQFWGKRVIFGNSEVPNFQLSFSQYSDWDNELRDETEL